MSIQGPALPYWTESVGELFLCNLVLLSTRLICTTAPLHWCGECGEYHQVVRLVGLWTRCQIFRKTVGGGQGYLWFAC